MRVLLAVASEQGGETLVFTVDMPVPGARYRDAHSGMYGPFAPARRLLQALGRPGWAWDAGVCGRPHRIGNVAPVLGATSGLTALMGCIAQNFDPSFVWRDSYCNRSTWKGSQLHKDNHK